MPGLYGIVSFDQKPDPVQFGKLGSKISPAFENGSRLESGPALIGFKSLGILDQINQPFCDRRNNLSLFFWGEIFSHPFKTKPIAELIFELYRLNQLERLAELNGFFSFALWDEAKQSLILASDIYATRPIFYWLSQQKLVFASSPFAISQTLGLNKIDFSAMEQFLSWGMITAGHTWVEGVKKLRFGRFLRFNQEGIQITQYFRPVFHPEKMTIGEAARGIINGLAASAQRMASGKTAISLSGGGDSRLAALACKEAEFDLPTFTYGGEQSKDIEIAGQFCGKFGIRHDSLLISPDYLKDGIQDSVLNTNGYISAVNFHGISTRAEVKKFADICLSGLWGNEFLGYLSLRLAWFERTKSKQRFHTELQNWMTCGFKPAELDNLIRCDREHPNLSTTLEHLLSEYQQASFPETFHAFDCFETGSQQSLAGFWLENDLLEFRDLYCDYDLMKFNFTIPVEFKWLMRLGHEIWSNHFPEAGKIIYQRTGLPISASIQRVAIQKAIDRLLGKPALSGILNYSRIFRVTLADWIREFLLSDSSRNQEYLNREAILKLIASHLEGRADRTAKIGLLLTFEQVLRILQNKK